jgi:branched-chain amino acid transport system permease protein
MSRLVLKEILLYAALLAAVAAFPWLARSHYLQSVGVMVGIYSLVALGLCLLVGYAGQASLGQAGFYGLGAYSTGILTTRLHLDPWLAMVAGVLLTCAVAWAVGRPTLRLKGHYLAMATLGVGIIVQIVLQQAEPLTGGFGGMTSVPPLSLAGHPLTGDVANFYLVWLAVIAGLAVSRNVVDSRMGRALRAIHDSEIAASACGVDVAQAKVKVFVLGAGLASVAGSLYASYISFISPDPFGLAFSVQLLVMVIVGGSRSVWGALLGAALMTALGQQIDKTEAIKSISDVVYGTVMILFVVFMPTGMAGLLQRAGRVGLRLARGGASG